MYLLAQFLATLLLLALYVVTSRRKWSIESNRERMFEWVRFAGLTLMWGNVLTSLLAVLLPSPWS